MRRKIFRQRRSAALQKTTRYSLFAIRHSPFVAVPPVASRYSPPFCPVGWVAMKGVLVT
ncbi:MAG: hypothetical protein ACO2PL_05290 [Armatimonadota bacterium]